MTMLPIDRSQNRKEFGAQKYSWQTRDTYEIVNIILLEHHYRKALSL